MLLKMYITYFHSNLDTSIQKNFYITETFNYSKFEELAKDIRGFNLDTKNECYEKRISLFFEGADYHCSFSFKIHLINVYDFIRDVTLLINNFNQDLLKSMIKKESY